MKRERTIQCPSELDTEIQECLTSLFATEEDLLVLKQKLEPIDPRRYKKITFTVLETLEGSPWWSMKQT